MRGFLQVSNFIIFILCINPSPTTTAVVPPLPKRAKDFGSVLQRMLVRWFLLVNNSLQP